VSLVHFQELYYHQAFKGEASSKGPLLPPFC
jgi:hypothetical protein